MRAGMFIFSREFFIMLVLVIIWNISDLAGLFYVSGFIAISIITSLVMVVFSLIFTGDKKIEGKVLYKK